MLYLRLDPSRRCIPAETMLQEFTAFERLPVTVAEADLLRDLQIHLPMNESDFLQSRKQIRGARKHRPDRSFELETRAVVGGWERHSGIARTLF